ncbi:MAG: site-2 protease family protein [Planctomycetia bacterium]|nr:site-2 protease family protein [Planctomycetia bacterium]
MFYQPDFNRPMTPSERNGAIFFLLLFFGAFTAEVIVDYHPAKLTGLFIAGWWIPLLALHEAGHALAAWLVRWQVLRISIGHGPLVRRFHIGSAEVDLRLIPVSGYVMSAPTRLRWPQLENSLIYAAGPGIELVLLGAIAAIVGPEQLLHRTEAIWLLAVQALAVAILFDAFTNLVPMTVSSKDGPVANDGLGIFRSFLLSTEAYAKQIGFRPTPEADA